MVEPVYDAPYERRFNEKFRDDCVFQQTTLPVSGDSLSLVSIIDLSLDDWGSVVSSLVTPAPSIVFTLCEESIDLLLDEVPSDIPPILAESTVLPDSIEVASVSDSSDYSLMDEMGLSWEQLSQPEDVVAQESLAESFDDLLPPFKFDTCGVSVGFDCSCTSSSSIGSSYSALVSKKRSYSEDTSESDFGSSTPSDTTLSKKKRRNLRHRKEGVVGRESPQMKVIDQMVCYLKESTTEDRSLLVVFQNIINECEIRHLDGQAKFQHLPGVVFDKVVAVIGGSTFGRIYASSQAKYQSKSASTEAFPSILELAVEYGFYLAKSDHGGAIDESNMEKVVKQEVKRFLELDDWERAIFWQRILKHT